MIKLLVESGAGTDWTEPDGTAINKTEIETWTTMSDSQLRSFREHNRHKYAFCEVNWYDLEYPLYACNEGKKLGMYRDRSFKQFYKAFPAGRRNWSCSKC